MFEIVLSLFIFVRSIDHRKYHYTFVSILSIPVFMSLLYRRNTDNISHAGVWNVVEIILLILLTVVLLYGLRKNSDDKANSLPVVFSGLACILHIFKTMIFDYFAYEKNIYHWGMSVLQSFSLFLMLGIIAWTLYKDKPSAINDGQDVPEP